jgi:hypothetical protein
MPYDIAAGQILAQPVSAFFQGRALRLSQDSQEQRMALANAENTRAQESHDTQQKQAQIQFGEVQAKKVYAASQQVMASDNPKALVEQQFPEFIKDYQAHGRDWSTVDDNTVKQLAQGVGAHAAAELGITPVKGDEYTLKPGEKRYQGTKEIAAVPDKPDAITAYQQAQLGNDKQRLQLEQAKLDWEKSKPAAGTAPPSGYQWKADKSGLEPIPGGPADPNTTSTGMDSRSSVMFNRVASSAQAATKAIQNIMELPVTSSSGWFGTAEPGHGLMQSGKNVLAQKVTGQEAQDFKTMVAGVSRNLSTIETAGLAPNGAITNSMNNVLLGEGDTQMTKLRKMAEMRQIVEENLKPQLANPKLAPAQKDLIRSIIGDVQKSVPFTHHDITMLQQSKNSKATIADFATQQGLPTASGADASKGPVQVKTPQEAMALPSGTHFVTPDGRVKVRP